MPMPTHSTLRSGMREGGFAMIAMVALIVLISTYLLVKQLNAAGLTSDRRTHNAKVLNQAKQALIGYVAQQAAQVGENNPGRLPCPEAVNNIGTSSEGISAPWVGPPATPNCAMVGRLPWRTLGLDKLLDAASEPLWYVVSPGWTLQNSSTTLDINSNTQGQLIVNGLPAPNEVIALIIAPGPTMNVQATAGCTPRAQSRTAPSPAIDPLDYIECFDSAASKFSTTGPSISFNDQVLRVTTADLLPGIEAAIKVRIEREIVPKLKEVYAGQKWGLTDSNPTCAVATPPTPCPFANPVFPYAAPFANPGPGLGSSDFRGVAGTFQGLLPFNQTQGCNPATDVRCTNTLTAWASPSPAPPPDVTQIGGFGYFQTKTCSWQSSGNVANCEGEYHEDNSNPGGPGMRISMTATINNVAMGLRLLDSTKATIEAKDDTDVTWITLTPDPLTVTMNSNGSVTINLTGTLPNIDFMGWLSYANYRIRLQRSVIGDHPLLDATTVGPGATGWFVRNEWYRLLYYALAPGHAASGTAPRSCESITPTCLSVTNVSPTNKQRAILILAGRSLANPPPAPRTLADFVEFGNADGNLVFEQQPVSRAINAALKKPFNDRIIVLDANP